jgi:hypothetical protein
MALNLKDFVGNDQLMSHKKKKMTGKQMEINRIVLDILNKLGDFYLFVVSHEHEVPILVSMDGK